MLRKFVILSLINCIFCINLLGQDLHWIPEAQGYEVPIKHTQSLDYGWIMLEYPYEWKKLSDSITHLHDDTYLVYVMIHETTDIQEDAFISYLHDMEEFYTDVATSAWHHIKPSNSGYYVRYMLQIFKNETGVRIHYYFEINSLYSEDKLIIVIPIEIDVEQYVINELLPFLKGFVDLEHFLQLFPVTYYDLINISVYISNLELAQ